MTWIKKESDGSFKEFNFVAPDGASASEEVLFPIGQLKAPEYASTLAVDIEQMETFLQPEELTGNVTINLTVDDQVTLGAKLHLKLTADDQGAKTVTLGTGFGAPATIAVASDSTAYVSFVFDGTEFIPTYEIPT